MKRNLPVYLLGIAVLMLMLAGVAMLAAYFALGRDSGLPLDVTLPTEGIVAESVAPDLAVLTLAGEPDDRVIRAALDARETETAFAALAYGMLLSDTQRSGHWLLLAGLLKESDRARAATALRAAFDHAALSPVMSDATRADLSLQVARGFAGIELADEARLAATQAENIARYSLSILPAQRRALLGRVIEAYRAIGEAKLATTLATQADAYATGPGFGVPQPTALLPELRGGITLPPDVTTAIVARQQAAATLAARWLDASTDARANLATALGSALVAEDAARVAFYSDSQALELPERLAALHDQVAWLTVRYRVAQGDYGVSLMPDWEDEKASTRDALTAAVTDLVNGYGQQLDTLDPVEAAPARLELLRQAMLWFRLGLFPGAAEQTLSGLLDEASRQSWTQQGNAGLAITRQDVGGRTYYLLAGAPSPAP